MIEFFSEWLKGLIDEDKKLGLHPVNRGLKSEHELYMIYKRHQIGKSSTNRQQ